MEENNLRVTSYKEVSEALGKKLVRLYEVKIFPRQGKVFADMLFQTGIEAGSYLAALADIEERSVKINLATNAMLKLNQTDYLIDVMREAKYYTAAQVVELDEFLQNLTNAMRELLNSVYAQMRADAKRKKETAVADATPPVQARAPQKPQHREMPKVEIKPASKPPVPVPPQQPIPPNAYFDPDGFLIPAEDDLPEQQPVQPAEQATEQLQEQREEQKPEQSSAPKADKKADKKAKKTAQKS